MFHEDLPECRLFVKFKYDYNMLFTDALIWIDNQLPNGGKASDRRIPISGLGRRT